MTEQDRPAADEWRDRDHPIREDMATQRRSWRLQRIGWALMAVLLVAALLGLFSEGPLSHTTARAAEGRLEVAYQRFLRNGAASDVTFRFRDGPGGATEVMIGPAFARALTLESVRPTPTRSRATAEGLALTFEFGPDGRGEVHLSVRPNGPGLIDAPVRLAGSGVPARLGILVYP